jgi:small GTP-binding protein
MNEKPQNLQLIIVGESCVGKTSLLYKYTQGTFRESYLSTIGLEYFTSDEKINGKHIKVKIWDTAGQEEYKSLTKNYFHNADGIIIVYDVSKKSTFDKVQEWVNSIYDYSDSEKNVQKVLVANKIDLEREVSKEEGEKMAESFEIPYFETSAKEDFAIKDVMKRIIEDSLNNIDFNKKGERLSLNKNNNDGKGCSC